jgi:replicative DNA helicase
MTGLRNAETRQEEVAGITRSLKSLAKELNVPLVVISQINRAVGNRRYERPLLSDLRESGAIENNADLVVFIHRPELYGFPGVEGEAEAIIAKQRNGPVGSIRLSFNKQYVRFEDYSGRTPEQIDEGFDNGRIIMESFGTPDDSVEESGLGVEDAGD